MDQRLRLIMIAHGVSQKTFAQTIGATQSSVSRWLTGKGVPSIYFCGRIAEMYGINPAWLIGVKGCPMKLEKIPECSDEVLNAYSGEETKND